MSTLFPMLPFADDETPLSWAVRLAALHTRGRVLSFLTDLGIPLVELARGEPMTLSRSSKVVTDRMKELRLIIPSPSCFSICLISL